MTAEIRVIHSGKILVAKNGKKYRKVICAIWIDGYEYVKEFIMFNLE